MTTNTFCHHLSNGYRIFIRDNKISYLPCCYWDGPELPFDNLIATREQLNTSVPWVHKECQKCRTEEEYKKENSYRHVGNRIIPIMPSSKVGWLDIQADITCNGGCLICGPWSSSYWQQQLSKYGEYQLKSNKEDFNTSIDTIFANLDVSELRQLQFLGGEPMLSSNDQHALTYITNPEICILKYTTNGSIYPGPARMAQWNKFKSVTINFSLDGIGDRFGYLRYPLKWDTVESNIKRLVAEAPDNMVFHINHTVTPFNIFYYNEFIDWVDNTFPKDKFKGIHTHTAYGIMSAAYSTVGLRQAVHNIYGGTHVLSRMLDSLPQQNTVEFLSWIDKWDRRRNTNWLSTFPEVVKYFS